MQVVVGGIYRHFKGATIKIIAIAMHSETKEKMVVYNHQDTNEIWVRPYDMFISKVDKEKYPDIEQEYRFHYLGE